MSDPTPSDNDFECKMAWPLKPVNWFWRNSKKGLRYIHLERCSRWIWTSWPTNIWSLRWWCCRFQGWEWREWCHDYCWWIWILRNHWILQSKNQIMDIQKSCQGTWMALWFHNNQYQWCCLHVWWQRIFKGIQAWDKTHLCIISITDLTTKFSIKVWLKCYCNSLEYALTLRKDEISGWWQNHSNGKCILKNWLKTDFITELFKLVVMFFISEVRLRNKPWVQTQIFRLRWW